MSKKETVLFILMVVTVVTLAVTSTLMGRKARVVEEGTPKWMEPMIASLQKDLSEIQVADGIDATEATVIAGLFLSEFMGGCGVTGKPELDDGQWKLKTRLGATGKIAGSIISVDAKTGGVSKPSGPSYPTLQAFSDDLVNGFARRRQ